MSLAVINPYNQEIAADLPYDTDTQVKEKIASARSAFETWQRTTIGDRIGIVMISVEFATAYYTGTMVDMVLSEDYISVS